MKMHSTIIFAIILLFPLFFSCKKSNNAIETSKEEVAKEDVLRDLKSKVLIILGQDYYKKTIFWTA